MVQREADRKLSGHSRWPLAAVCVTIFLAASTLNITHSSKAHALDLLQPLTSILDTLLGPAPSRSITPEAASPSQSPSNSSQEAPPVIPPAPSPNVAEPQPSTIPEATYVPLETELKPLVLGAASDEPKATELLSPETPSLAQSVIEVETWRPQHETCSTLFGACWHLWIPAIVGLISMMFFTMHSRFDARFH